MERTIENNRAGDVPSDFGADPVNDAARRSPIAGNEPEARRSSSPAQRAVVLLLLLASVAGIFFPLFRHLNVGMTATDYPYHAMFAEEIRRTKKKTVPHFLFHEVLIVVKRTQEALTGVRPYVHRPTQPPLPRIVAEYATASAVTCLLFTELLAFLVWAELCRSINVNFVAGSAWAAFLTLTLLFVAPVAVIGNFYYLGYIGTNVWHSPTMLAVKPTALLTFWCVLGAFASARASQPAMPRLAERIGFCAVLAGLVVLSALAKPNWVMCLIPAIGLAAVAWDLSGRRVDWVVLLLGMVAPAGLVLIWQFRLTYLLGQSGGGITFAPLRVMSGYATHLGTKFMLSILFPACVYLFYFREARTSLRLNLSWLAFIVGAMYTYLVAETKRVLDGNFTWGAQIALFVLFVESVVLVVRALPVSAVSERREQGRKGYGKLASCGVAYLAHVVFGVWYYVHLMRADPAVPGFFS